MLPNVSVSHALPVPPSDREVARRIVRHGLADVLEWLGEDVGPKPADQIHAVRTWNAMIVSPQLADGLKVTRRVATGEDRVARNGEPFDIPEGDFWWQP